MVRPADVKSGKNEGPTNGETAGAVIVTNRVTFEERGEPLDLRSQGSAQLEALTERLARGSPREVAHSAVHLPDDAGHMVQVPFDLALPARAGSGSTMSDCTPKCDETIEFLACPLCCHPAPVPALRDFGEPDGLLEQHFNLVRLRSVQLSVALLLHSREPIREALLPPIPAQFPRCQLVGFPFKLFGDELADVLRQLGGVGRVADDMLQRLLGEVLAVRLPIRRNEHNRRFVEYLQPLLSSPGSRSTLFRVEEKECVNVLLVLVELIS